MNTLNTTRTVTGESAGVVTTQTVPANTNQPVETKVKRSGVGRPRHRAFLFLANEDGTPKMGEDNQPIRAGRGKPSPKNNYVWLIPPDKNGSGDELTYRPGTPPAKKEKAVASQPVVPEQTENVNA